MGKEGNGGKLIKNKKREREGREREGRGSKKSPSPPQSSNSPHQMFSEGPSYHNIRTGSGIEGGQGPTLYALLEGLGRMHRDSLSVSIPSAK